MISISAHLLLNFLESYFIMAEVLNSESDDKGLDQRQVMKRAMKRGRLLFAVGALRRPESLNKVTLMNALHFFNKRGYLKFVSRKNTKNQQVVFIDEKRDALLADKDRLFRWIKCLDKQR